MDAYSDGNTDGTETQQQHSPYLTADSKWDDTLQTRALISKPANENQDFYPKASATFCLLPVHSAHCAHCPT